MIKDRNYIIGLNVSNNSIGYALIDPSGRLLEPVHGKKGIGARFFSPQESKADRRVARGERRNTYRTKIRVKLLNKKFKKHIEKIDPDFFERLRESNLSPADARKHFRNQIFPTYDQTKAAVNEFPTIFHLEKYLMNTRQKADIRLIYSAFLNIAKHRGHDFLNTPFSQFIPGKIDLNGFMKAMESDFANVGLQFADKNIPDLKLILIDPSLSKKDKRQKLEKKLFDRPKNKGGLRPVCNAIVNGILGNKTDLAKMFQVKGEKWNISFKDDDLDAELDEITPSLTNDQQDAVRQMLKLFNAVQLADILHGRDNLPDTMIDIYNQHAHDLNTLKKYISHEEKDDQKKKLLQAAYDLYIGNISTKAHRKRFMEAKKLFNNHKFISKQKRSNMNSTLSPDAFRSFVKSVLEDDENQALKKDIYEMYKDSVITDTDKNGKPLTLDELVKKRFKVLKPEDRRHDDPSKRRKEMLNEIIANSFMPKQRSTANSVIPYQLNELTLNRIIKNQGKFYPFLAEKNPLKGNSKNRPYLFDQLIFFRIPYYVGPLATRTDQEKSGIPAKSRFSWLIRKEKGQITPFNLKQKVNIVETANNFIKRMIKTDTFLYNVPVLPKNSLLYQEYVVYEELSDIMVNDRKLTGEQKQLVFNGLFKKYKTVSVAKFKNFMSDHGFKVFYVHGLADPKKFNATYSTYIDFKKIFGSLIDDPSKRADFEKMITWSTVFDSKSIFAIKLSEIKWLNEVQTKKVVQTNYSGWGRFSKELLTGLKDKNGKSIMDYLKTGTENFNQIKAKDDFKEAIAAKNEIAAEKNSPENIIESAYASPEVQKAVRQALKIVAENVKRAGGNEPKFIVLRFNRSKQEQDQLTEQRDNRLNQIYRKHQKDPDFGGIYQEFQDFLESQKKRGIRRMSKKQYLYFQQKGRDAFTGMKLNLSSLWRYQVKSIIPQRIEPDNSMDNSILVDSRIANEAPNKLSYEYANDPVPELKTTVGAMWLDWSKAGLIPKYKYYNLLDNPDFIDPKESATKQARQERQFINHQLVANNIVVKLLATILKAIYPQTTILEVRGKMINSVRYQLGLTRLSLLNKLYLGYDAYLCANIGNYLYQVYPKLRSFFVYGDFKKLAPNSAEEKQILLRLGKINFLHDLLFGSKHGDDILQRGTKKKVFSRKALIANMRKAYNYKFQSFSVQLEKHEGKLFKASIFPTLKHNVESSRTLIPLKKDRPTELYGGYSANQNGYMALILVTILQNKKAKKFKKEYRIVGIPARWPSQLKNKKNLEQKLQEKYVDGKITSLKLIKAPVLYNQLIRDQGRYFYLGSEEYLHNARQLLISPEDQQTIADYVQDPEFVAHKEPKGFNRKNGNSKLISLYSDLLHQLNANFKQLNLLVKKVQTGKDKFAKLSLADKERVMRGLLEAMQIGVATFDSSLKKIGITYVSATQKPLKLSSDAEFIYTSRTGLGRYVKPIKDFRAES